MWNGLKVAFLIIGTTIGAGYASGREIWEFFSSYGQGSSIAIVLSVILYSICCYIIMSLSQAIQAPHYVQVLEVLMGKTLSKCYDVLIFSYLFSTTVVMFAGSGATFSYWEKSYWLGVCIMALFVMLIFLRGVHGIMSLNSILIPLLITTLLAVSTLYVINMSHAKEIIRSSQPAFASGIAFTALNILPLIAVLSAIGAGMSKKEMKVAAGTTVVILSLISLMYNEALLILADLIYLYEVPLFALLNEYPAEMMVAVSLMLWLAIYTTAISNLLGMVSRFKEWTRVPKWLIALLCILLVIPMTQFGFGNLITFLYPLYGVLNLFVLGVILLYPLANINKIR